MSGLVSMPARQSVAETVSRLQQTLDAKGIKTFAVIDHSGEAHAAGLEMPETKLLIFGNPHAGTPLMLASPTIAIDLPLKILVWTDARGQVWITYNDPHFIARRHDLPENLTAPMAAISALIADLHQ